MSYFKVCPHCGAALDPGEVCDCTIAQVCTEARAAFPERFTGRTDRQVITEIAGVVRRYRQLTPENQDKFDTHVDRLLMEQETALDATNIQDGGAEQSLTAVSASTITEDGGFVK